MAKKQVTQTIEITDRYYVAASKTYDTRDLTVRYDLTEITGDAKYPNATLVSAQFSFGVQYLNGTTKIDALAPYDGIYNTIASDLTSSTNTVDCPARVLATYRNTPTGTNYVRFKIHNNGARLYLNNVVLTLTYEYGTVYKATTFTAGNILFGESSVLTLTNSDLSSLTGHTVRHTARWTFGNHTHTINRDTTSGHLAAISYTIQKSWADYIPNARTGPCTIRLTTYVDDEEMGYTEKTITLTLAADDSTRPDAPTVTAVSTGDVAAGSYVQGIDRVILTGSSTAKYGATIASWEISGAISSTATGASLNYQSGVLTVSGSQNIKVTVRDSRGLGRSVNIPISVIPNEEPEYSFLAYRVDNDGNPTDEGTRIAVSLDGSYSPITIGGQNYNSISRARLDYKAVGDASYTAITNLTNASGADFSNGRIYVPESTVISTVTFAAGTNYMIRMVVTDNRGHEVTKELALSSTVYTMHFKKGGTGVAFGKIAKDDNTVEVRSDWNLKTGAIEANGAISVTGADNLLDTQINLGLVYKAGDSVTNGAAAMAGYVTNSTRSCYLYLTTPKSLANVNTVNVTKFIAYIRTTNGAYLEGIASNTSGNKDWTQMENITVSASILNDNTIEFIIAKTAALSNAANNTPVFGYGASISFTLV